MKILILVMFVLFACNTHGIAEEIKNEKFYSVMFVLFPILNDIPPVEDVNPNKGDFLDFSFVISQLDFDKEVHKQYDRAISLKIKGKENITFNVFFINGLAMKIEKIELPSLEKIYYEREFPSANNINYPTEYLGASNAAYAQLMKHGDLFFYLKEGENKIGVKNVLLDKKSSVVLIKYYEGDYIQSLSINNGNLYNIAIGKHPDVKSPWGDLFFSVTLVQQNIVAGTIKTENQYFDCSFFNKYGLERYMTGANGAWSNVTIWNENGKIEKQISYSDWLTTMNQNN